MALETGTYISDLVSTNPAGTDTLDKADDHLRLIKSTVKATFPNAAGPIGLSSAAASGAAILSVTDNTNAALRVTQLGTGLALRIEDSANPDSTPFVVDNAGNVGIATASPTVKLEIGSTDSTTFFKNSGATTGYAFADIVNTGCTFRYGVSTAAGSFWASGVAGGYSANLGTATASALGLGTNDTLRMTIDSSGNVLVTSSGGLGYGTGSGGTVTQITSKSTAVTLNKTNGQITMNAAALASGTPALFTLNNTTIATTDVVMVCADFPAILYRAWVYAVGAGSCSIAVQQDSGSSQSDAVVINFAVIKAVTS